MERAPDASAAFAQFARSIRASLASISPFVATRESAGAIQVERGIVLAHVMKAGKTRPGLDALESIEPLIQLASTTSSLSRIAVVDADGNHHPVYRPLLIYSWLVSFSLLYESLPRREHGRWEESLRSWCDLLESDLGDAIWTGDHIAASGASAAAEAAWIAVALQVAGKIFVRDVWLDLASDFFGKLTRTQHPEGSFIATDAAGDVEPTTIKSEMMILHAGADYALAAKDRNVAAVVARGAHYAMAHTTPEPAVVQPWALFAFIWNPATRDVADRMLRRSEIAPGSHLNWMLLADALYSLAAFGVDTP